ncbi:hypothetical protein ACFCV3_35600 [Kribbella sp. NPDC056345]|uniref:hypothetical protein n=1 Tax=Kribbella sp. NPDC056345 TaxID=3345789 RepID=UPI0035DCE4E4
MIASTTVVQVEQCDVAGGLPASQSVALLSKQACDLRDPFRSQLAAVLVEVEERDQVADPTAILQLD